MAEMKVYGVGVATADAENKIIGSKNTPVCNVNLAFNRGFKGSDGEWQNEVAFVRVQMFGQRAANLKGKIKKGTPVFIDGYIVLNKWETDEGQTRTQLLVNARDMQVCERTPKKESANNENLVAANSDSGGGKDGDDDIPF